MKDELRKIKQHPMFSNLMMEYGHRGMTDEVSQYIITILNDHHMINLHQQGYRTVKLGGSLYGINDR